MKKVLPLLLALWVYNVQAQPQATSKSDQKQAIAQKMDMAQNSWLKNLPYTNIGPTIMSGRVVDVDVNPDNPIEFYVAYASGGLWYTDNNGTSFSPVMDESPTQNLGDIAVDWKNGTLWAGTGENNASRSSYAGIGILKSTDKGKTWHHVGLADSHHIGRILINPNNPDEVVVGVTGHLYSSNAERGIYKTTDGGKTWNQTLFVDTETGIIDLIAVPGDFNTLFASAWQKDRKAWHFEGSGNGSGIYKSTDAGQSWTLVSGPESGFPTGKGVGRIGLAAFDGTTIYAVHDSQFRQEKKPGDKKKEGLDKDDFKTMDNATFLALEDKKLNNFLKTNGFQEKYRAENVKQLVRSGTVKPADLATYLEDANSLLFDTPVVGGELFRSDDGGKTWTKRNEDDIEGLFFSYGYYFAQISVAPQDKDQVYLGGVLLFKSDDGGKTFANIQKENVHADHHAIWLNPKRAGHIINGNDGGINITYDDGAHWTKNNSPSVGQFYYITVDNEEPYNVYGGLQDNGVWKGAHTAKEDRTWEQEGQYPWKTIMGGDGMQVQVDNRNSNIVYTGYQFGNYYRLDLENDGFTYIQPKHELGDSPFRFNWQTPILLSEHNQDILYLGSNRLHRSLDQGDTWETISEDLTQGGKKGNVAYGTLTALTESPSKFGLLYTGSDDGLVHLYQDGQWKNRSAGLPKDLWVSRVRASGHQKERVYVSLNGYRWDDFTPYVYMSEDYGATWTSIAANLPKSPVNVITEDPENAEILYVGTDNGVYISLDRGTSWQHTNQGIPAVAVHDLIVQPKAKHLLVGTHGRSIYKADIGQLQQISTEVLAKPLHFFKLEDIKHKGNWGNDSVWAKADTPGQELYFTAAEAGTVTTQVIDEKGLVVSEVSTEADKGLNILSYDVAYDANGVKTYKKKHKKEAPKAAKNGKTYLPKGKYRVVLQKGKTKVEQGFSVK